MQTWIGICGSYAVAFGYLARGGSTEQLHNKFESAKVCTEASTSLDKEMRNGRNHKKTDICCYFPVSRRSNNLQPRTDSIKPKRLIDLLKTDYRRLINYISECNECCVLEQGDE